MRDMGLYEVPLFVSLLSFGIGIVCQLPCVRYYVLREVLNIFARNASPRGPMCLKYLIFSLSGPCELLFLLCLIASWT